MRQTLLIALREYKQYILSRGFLLFLIMFPLGLIFMSVAFGFLERNKPVRSFVVFDQTGAYVEAIDRALDRRHRFNTLYGFDAYVTGFKRSDVDVDALPEPYQPGSVTDRRVQDFQADGGIEAAQAAIAPYLREGDAAFRAATSGV